MALAGVRVNDRAGDRARLLSGLARALMEAQLLLESIHFEDDRRSLARELECAIASSLAEVHSLAQNRAFCGFRQSDMDGADRRAEPDNLWSADPMPLLN